MGDVSETMRVPLVETEDGRRPGLPEWAAYTIIEWHDDGTVTVRLNERTVIRMVLEQATQK